MVAAFLARVGESMEWGAGYYPKIELIHILDAPRASRQRPAVPPGGASGLGSLEPGPRVHRLARFADFEIQLRAVTAATVAGGAQGIPRAHSLAHRLVEPLVVPVQAHIAFTMINNGQQPEPREPVGIDHAAAIDRPDRRATLRRDEHSVPFDAARACFSEPRNEFAAHGPRELAAQVRESIVVVDRKLLDGPPQLPQQLLQSALLALQAFQVLRVRVGFGGQARQHLGAFRARLLQLGEVGALLPFQLRELGILRLQLLIERRDSLDIALDAVDLLGTRTPEVAVIDEHAARPLGVLLVQQQLQRLFAPDQVGGTQLT